MPNHIQETNAIRHERHEPARLDPVDRTLLGVLAEDSSRSYAELGEILNLSAPAVHERVKRLKRDGVIKATVAKINGCKVGRTLLTFILVNTKNVVSTKRLLQLSSLPEIEEIHTIAGDSSVIIKVRAQDTESLEELLGKVQDIDGVDGTRSYVVLSTFVERGPSPHL
jgi:Lrp/AsnC family leucine-responsive transcriptional regulator